MYTYHIEFTRNGATETVHYRAWNAISAFERCLRRFPNAKLIGTRGEDSYRENGQIFCSITTYAPPSTVKIKAKPAAKEEQLAFGFLENLPSRNATKTSGKESGASRYIHNAAMEKKK